MAKRQSALDPFVCLVIGHLNQFLLNNILKYLAQSQDMRQNRSEADGCIANLYAIRYDESRVGLAVI